MEINELREQIDAIDRQLVELLARRLGVALEINEAKQALRLPLRDAQREAAVTEYAREHAPAPLHASEAAAWMQQVLDASRAAVKRRMSGAELPPMRIAIVGLGLVGGSIARALKRAQPDHTLVGIDLAERLEAPRKSGLFKSLHTAADGAKAVGDAAVVFLCASPSRNLELLGVLLNDVSDHCIITDVGGVKRAICDKARTLFAGPGPLFVGGHPMAGKAVSGFANSSADLFDGRAWVLAPEPDVPADRLRVLQRLVESIGGAVQLLTAEEHDRIIPAVSHLPQLVAVALMLTIGGRDHGIAGPALREMTRLAESSGELWQELLAASRSDVVGEIQRLRSYLTEMEIALGLGDHVTHLFQRANDLRRDMLRASVIGPEAGE
ncbi:MAG: prephenate dehydrogenase/arogenate dehydrogenase family protein [Planctomycetes bacterium]|nr:prephenate dehydrogenase/arogenate dehydrogenase family protein [Planctomycetota bacterium]